jgi:hypothetical protein
LYTFAIELAFWNKNHKLVDQLYSEIVKNSRSLMDTIPAHVTHLNSLGSRGACDQAISEGLQILKELGEPFPRRLLSCHTIFRLFSTRKMLRAATDEQILKLPRVLDAKILAASKIMHAIFVFLLIQRSGYLPLVAMRIIDLTLQYGLSPLSKFFERAMSNCNILSPFLPDEYRFSLQVVQALLSLLFHFMSRRQITRKRIDVDNSHCNCWMRFQAES